MADNARLLSTDLAGKLRIEILTERMRAGDKLTEQMLCERFGVSRTPVREALKNLETEGLIDMIPNRGAFVIGLTQDDLRDLYTLRMQSEMQAVRWAIERRANAEMEAVEESLDFMRFYTGRCDAKRMRSINAGFHRRIVAASHNRILAESLSRIQDYIRYSARVLPYRETDLPVILKEHTAVFKAFKANDPEAGAFAMQKHIENSLLRANI
ncbi:MAG: GntR family transcriptional regulator [Clostridiales Family XIII bacterium]|jgi:DNA-binding GntR family transcriptional regulator|nr:GntR family transcriptional regulator [Clostridiales Family XIII bacterium]